MIPGKPSRFQNIQLWHGENGHPWEPSSSVKQIEDVLSRGYPEVRFTRPLLAHDLHYKFDESYSLQWLEDRYIQFIAPGSLIVGISLGGLLAAKIQELHPELNLSIFALVAPTSSGNVKLEKPVDHRVSLYSTVADEVIKGHCEDWPKFASHSFDVPWLQHNIDLAKYACCYLISCYMRGLNMRHEVETLFPAAPPDTGELYTV
jgi:predicted esterase YcpF (UPF0227 family)